MKTKLKGRTYPWDEWVKAITKSGSLSLTKTADYNGMSHTFAVQVRRNFNARGYSVSVATKDRSVTIRVTGKLRRGKK